MLDILIASIEERAFDLAKVVTEFRRQGVDPIVVIDNKEMTIGKKRQMLLEMATKEWIVFFDDDDWPSEGYVANILKAIERNPGADCCGIWGRMTVNGASPKTWRHRLGMPFIETMSEGFNYTRPIMHFNPVLRTKALEAGFDITSRWGEDVDYAKRLNPLLTKEAFVHEPLFLYRYSNKIPHETKYGIK